MAGTSPFKRASRSDYVPGVRPRTARQDGQRRLGPGYLTTLSDTKFTYVNNTGRTTRRSTLLTPTAGTRLRLIRVAVHQTVSDGLHYAELYFGTGTSIATYPSKAIDLIRVADQSEGSSRSWGRGDGPVGGRNEVLSFRWRSTTATSHKIIIEYTEER